MSYEKLNWIINNSKKLEYHTNLKQLLKPIEKDLNDYKWFIADLEINTSEMQNLPINHENEWYLISNEQMEQIRNSDTQIVWGVFSAINKEKYFTIKEKELPYSEGNGNIWKNGNFQIEESEIEIIAFDSSYTIVKFKIPELLKNLKNILMKLLNLKSLNKLNISLT